MNRRSIQIATVQMDVTPAPTYERLARAELQVCDAIELGADLVVLPELFNTGYIYHDDNFRHAEPEDGPTLAWLKHTARRQHTHLAATLLLRDGADIFNAMFLVSPGGRTWRYDKSYPFGWERGYFRESRQSGAARAVVADTDLGAFGMMVCWDAAHPELWQAYAGQVDLMVVCACPPEMGHLRLWLPDGNILESADLGPMLQPSRDDDRLAFGPMLEEQAAWLGVPVAVSTGCGLFESPIPNATASLLAMLPGKPSLARYLPRANQIKVSADMVETCKVVSAAGKPLARIPQARGEAFAIADVPLADDRVQPGGPQPKTRLSKNAYLLADDLLPRIARPVYQKGVGKH